MNQKKAFPDLLDYFALVADGVILTTSGLFLACWEFRGPDMDSMNDVDVAQMAAQFARKLKLPLGYTVQCDLIRDQYSEYCEQTSNWPDAVSYLIDQERYADL
jgi:type IV secretory pathway VirB4 component